MTSLGDDQLTIGGERWSLGRLIGKGGFASVYEAVASGSGLQAAVKVVDLSQQSTWAQSKLCTEAENLLRAQTHANIIQLYGEARHGQYHLFVMERWGRDLLESVLEHRGLGELCTQHVMVQVLRALVWLHDLRICHGYGTATPPPLRPAPPQARRARHRFRAQPRALGDNLSPRGEVISSS